MTNRRHTKSPAGETRSRNQPVRANATRRLKEAMDSAPAARRKEPVARRTSKSKSTSTSKSKTKTKVVKRPQGAGAASSARSSVRDSRLPLYQEPKRKPRSQASCTACGLCCSYVAIEVDTPKTVKQATQLLWYVYHEGVSLYVNDDEWMVQFDTTCVHLQPDYRCGVYETRPHICREFSEQDCEVNTGDDGQTFYTATEFMTYLQTSRPRIHAFVMKNFAPPAEPARARLTPFEHRFQAVLARRQALGIEG